MDDDYEYEVQPWELSDDSSGTFNLFDLGWNVEGSTWTDPQGAVFDLSYLEPGIVGEVKNFLRQLPRNAWGFVKGMFTNKDTGDIDWGKIATLGGAMLPLLQGSSQRPTGYQGGIPEYKALRETVPGTYDANRRPGSGGQRYFSDVAYVPQSTTGAAGSLKLPASAGSVEDLYQQVLGRPADASGAEYWTDKFGSDISSTEIREFTAAAQPELLRTQAQGLASLNAANPLNAAPPAYQTPAPPPAATQTTPAYNDAYSGENVLKTVREMLNPPVQPREVTQADPNLPPPVTYRPSFARGGIVGLQDGGFVVPADVVSHLGNGSSRAGISHLTRKGAVPIRGRGDGMSDSNRTTINGRQPAAVADGEAYFPPNKVQQMGGADRLYAMMDKIRKDRTGTTKQGKQINPNQYV